MVKIYGAGGLRGLEAYQTGFLISAEGHVLTVLSYVLDTDVITVTLDDGRKFEAQIAGRRSAAGTGRAQDRRRRSAAFRSAQGRHRRRKAPRVLAFSNLFGVATGDEPVSVQHGTIAAVTPLDARRGAFETPYHGPVYVLDAMTNNPGAAGGALTNMRGELLGMLGKELRNSQNNTWLNYAVPVNEIVEAVEAIIAGQTRPPRRSRPANKPPENPLTLADLGIVLVPNVLERTPPFVDTRAPRFAGRQGRHPRRRSGGVRRRPAGAVLQARCRLNWNKLERDAEVRLMLMRDNELIEVDFEGERMSRQSQNSSDTALSARSAIRACCLPLCILPGIRPRRRRSRIARRSGHESRRRARRPVASCGSKRSAAWKPSANVLVGTGPTTGLIVSSDGYIISSAFNFVQKPTQILVDLPDGTRLPAEVVAHDNSRMLVLLKVTLEGLECQA